MSDYTRSLWTHQSSPTPNRPHVRIVTDSASDILPSHAQAIGAFVVPSWIAMDGAYLRDGIDISASQFYARLPHLRTPPHTEPATPQEFYHVYQTAFRQGATAVVSIHVSSRLSKIVEHAMIARDHLALGTIDIIDSLQVASGDSRCATCPHGRATPGDPRDHHLNPGAHAALRAGRVA